MRYDYAAAVIVLITAADDSLIVMRAHPKILDDGSLEDVTDDFIQSEIDRCSVSHALGDLPAYPLEKLPIKSWRRAKEGETIPTDRTYRNAWKDNGDKIHTDMPRARELHKGMLREARASLMAELDIEYQRADEQGDANKKRAIAAKKQALRDITKHPDIEAAETPEQLKLAAVIK